MTPAARVQAAIELVDLISAAARDNGPAADTIIANWFKSRRFAGSKDRRAVREIVYQVIRAFGQPPETGRAGVLGLVGYKALFDGSPYGPEPIFEGEAAAVPSPLSDWLAALVPAGEVAAMLGRAPLDLRVNILKARVEEVQPQFPGAVLIDGLPNALRLADPVPLDSHPAARAGLVEVQDAGSQLVALACKALPGQTIIDLCAGAGGKTLALAADMAGRGRLIACDTDRARLSRLTPRAALAGAEGIEQRLLNPGKEAEMLADLAGSADVVLVDAPCSGSGTWRRNPESRWRLTPERLARVMKSQAHVLDVAASLVRPGGALVYAVCSLIAAEGKGQIDAFLDRRKGWLVESLEAEMGRACGPGRQLTPGCDGTDGFFIARLAKSC